MILNPSILALLVSSALISLLAVYACLQGLRVLRHWDLSSGSELQLVLERRTYLVSSVLAYLFGFQLFSLFLFVYTVDSLCTLFVGAMCAVGTLGANSFGYPTLFIKVVNFLLAGLWLILNYADNSGYDYPLIRKKYRLLLLVGPLLLAETIIQGLFFHGLKGDVITSCCGSLFSVGEKTVASGMAALPMIPMELAFFASIGALLAVGAIFLRSGRAGFGVAFLAGVAFVASLLSTLSFVSVYFYEMPSHRCPFCILQAGYDFIGYPFYGFVLVGTLTGLGVGVLAPCRSIPSLATTVASIQRRLTTASILCYAAVAVLVAARIWVSDYQL